MDSGEEWAVEGIAAALLSKDLLETVLHYGRLRRVTEYILNRLDSRVTLMEAAAYVQMHPASLSRYFSEKTGMGFAQFVRRVRIAAACQRLADEDCSIAKLALALGYENVSAFVRAFRILKGCPPTAYRKAHLRRALSTLRLGLTTFDVPPTA